MTKKFAEDLKTIRALLIKSERINNEYYSKWLIAEKNKLGDDLSFQKFNAVNLYCSALEMAEKYCKEAAAILNE